MNNILFNEKISIFLPYLAFSDNDRLTYIFNNRAASRTQPQEQMNLKRNVRVHDPDNWIDKFFRRAVTIELTGKAENVSSITLNRGSLINFLNANLDEGQAPYSKGLFGFLGGSTDSELLEGFEKFGEKATKYWKEVKKTAPELRDLDKV